MLIMKKEKREIIKGIQLANQESMKTFGEKENFSQLGILEADVLKQRWKKRKGGSLRRNRKFP